jgi:predicted nucleic-acid-binding protein
MIGLDTNVIVRYVMQDDPEQAMKASGLIETLTPERPGFVTLVSLIETVWVLISCYGLTRLQIAQFLEQLLSTDAVLIDRAEEVWRALRRFQASRADFADCLIACNAAAAGCECTMTFDARAAKAAGMTLIK